jgi:preprotein translocase subunit SecA
MPEAPLLAGSAVYPERESPRELALDRLQASLGFWYEQAFARQAPEAEEFARQVGAQSQRIRQGTLGTRLAEVRYRARRDGPSAERLAECLGLCCAAFGAQAEPWMSPTALGAAALLVKGRIAEVTSPTDRTGALVLAALALAVQGTPVHVMTASEARGRRLAELLRQPLEALGFSVAFVVQAMNVRERRQAYSASVVCGPQRVLATDYLRDRLLLGRRLGPLRGRLERLGGGARAGAQTALPGLHCALVDDADGVMLDDSRVPLVISADADQASQRLVHEQALELSRALAEGADFALGNDGAELTLAGAERLSRLVLPLGGAWLARQRSEQLVGAALDAVHVLQRDRDYRVVQGRLVIPEPEGAPPEEEEQDPLLRGMLEVKEGCKLSGARDVLARLSVARFFGRYLHLAGVCADARGLERDFWAMYSLKTQRCGPPQAPAIPCRARVFLATEARRAALVEAARTLVAQGKPVLLALRTHDEAQALAPLLAGLTDPNMLKLNLHPAQRDIEQPPAEGVHLLVAELHEAGRHVEQIRQAYGAMSCEQFLAMEDAAVAAAVGVLARARARYAAGAMGELPAAPAQRLAARAQRGAERAHSELRRVAAQRERQLEDLLAFSGQLE